MFGLFNESAKDVRYGVTVDIGSGKVSVAIVASRAQDKQPTILWTHTAYPENTREAATAADLARTLKQAFAVLEKSGLRALSKHDSRARVETVLATLTAPYAHTVAKEVEYKKDQPFAVTKRLIHNLEDTAAKKALEIVKEHKIAETHQLVPLNQETTSVRLNGYIVDNPYGKEVHDLTFTHITALGATELVSAIQDAQERVLKHATLHITTFTNVYYSALQSLRPHLNNVLLINVSAEATEFAFIEGGTLTLTSFAPVGAHHIAREVGTICGTTFTESIGLMKENGTSLETSCSQAKQKQLRDAVARYESELSNTLTKTALGHTIPRTVYVYTASGHGSFFKQRLGVVLQEMNVQADIFPVTAELFGDIEVDEPSVVLSGYVFHKEIYPIEAYQK